MGEEGHRGRWRKRGGVYYTEQTYSDRLESRSTKTHQPGTHAHSLPPDRTPPHTCTAEHHNDTAYTQTISLYNEDHALMIGAYSTSGYSRILLYHPLMIRVYSTSGYSRIFTVSYDVLMIGVRQDILTCMLQWSQKCFLRE